jgi:hypothetical protein
MTMAKTFLGGACFTAAMVAGLSVSLAQTARVDGEVKAMDGSMMTVKSSKGPEVKVKLADKLAIFGVEKATLKDIKVGDYVGVGAMPQPDGSQKAIRVTIFSETQRGTGEGFRPWDLPNSTMTNATVATSVTGVDGQELTVKYKDGEKKIIIGSDAVMLRYVAATKDELKPGAMVAVSNGKEADGVMESGRINVGKGGYVPK